nr:MAG TPA: hypothetical protein [Caudoviricetes sp.]DAG08871.1 MAG TPA: hypothetical protein [Caudoviricetes sp.]DAN88932.1 MAG TPA: hypothetical protein [Caudoviricetes sp.]
MPRGATQDRRSRFRWPSFILSSRKEGEGHWNYLKFSAESP